MKIYPLDLRIVQLLYNLEDKDQVLATLDTLKTIQIEITKNEINKFLLEIGKEEDEIAEMINDIFTPTSDGTKELKHTKLLTNEILEARILTSTQNFAKSIYDQQVPKLTPQNKELFDKYTELLSKKFEIDKKAVSLAAELQKDLLSNNQSQPNMVSAPPINLGGNMSNPRISTNVAQSQSQPSDAQITPQAKQPTIDTKPVSHNPEAQSVTTPVATQPVPPVAPIQVTPLQASEGDVLNV